MANQVESILNLPPLGIYGLEIANDATTPDEIITIAAGMCRDADNNVDMVLGDNFPGANGEVMDAPLSVSIAVNGVNGLDTGTVAASKVYAVWLISDSRNYKVTAGLLSLASNANPLMPFDYDSKRLIGYVVTDSSSDILLGYHFGKGNDRKWVFDAPQATTVTAGAATTFTAVDLVTLVPPVENVGVMVETVLTPSAAGRGVFLQGFNGTGSQITNLGQVTSVVLQNNDLVLAQLDTASPEIKYKVSNGSDAVAINVAGFEFSV